MNIEEKYLPRAVNVLLSVIGVGAAFLALRYFSNGDLGNALIYAGGALSLSVLPFGNMPRRFYKLPLNKLADELARRPEPLWQRIAVVISWLLVLSGFAVAIIYN